MNVSYIIFLVSLVIIGITSQNLQADPINAVVFPNNITFYVHPTNSDGPGQNVLEAIPNTKNKQNYLRTQYGTKDIDNNKVVLAEFKNGSHHASELELHRVSPLKSIIPQISDEDYHKSYGKPDDKPDNKPDDESCDEPNDKPDNKPDDTPGNKPDDTPTKKPNDEVHDEANDVQDKNEFDKIFDMAYGIISGILFGN